MWTFHLRWRRSVSLLALLSLPCVRHPDKSNPLLNKQLGLRYSGIVEDKAGLSSLDRIHFSTRCKSSGFIEFSTKNNSLLRCIGTWANFINTSAHLFFPLFLRLYFLCGDLKGILKNTRELLGTFMVSWWSSAVHSISSLFWFHSFIFSYRFLARSSSLIICKLFKRKPCV